MAPLKSRLWCIFILSGAIASACAPSGDSSRQVKLNIVNGADRVQRQAQAVEAPFWKSISPDAVSLPIFEIGLKDASTGQRIALYTCPEETNDGCLMELSPNPDTMNMLMTASGAVALGSYSKAYVKTCLTGNSYTGRVRATATLGGARYVTTATGLVASETLCASDTTYPGLGCIHDYPFPSTVTITDTDEKTLQVYLDLENSTWVAAGD